MSDTAGARLTRSQGLDGIKASADAHYALLAANLALRGVSALDSVHAEALPALDLLAALLAEGKWYLALATGDCADFAVPTHASSDAMRGASILRECADHAQALAAWIQGRDMLPVLEQHQRRLMREREILYLGAAPIVPSICPIVVLRGSWPDMGAQYVQQCIEIFGPFVFERCSRRSFDSAQQAILDNWAQELSRHAPDVLEFAHGMARGSTAASCAMTERQALALWTGWDPPRSGPEELGVRDSLTPSIMTYFGALREAVDERELCSGFAAWGSATAAGQLVAGSTTDHDCTFQATIIGFPAGGVPFIYTPFSVNGTIPGVGRFQFAGLPGVNRAGLAYVHHGGAIGACAEPEKLWGYGIRRGASTLEILGHEIHARDALRRELGWPVGDAGAIMGSPGGFYADPTYGYVLESRGRTLLGKDAIVREFTPGPNEERLDFLYANNNLQDPRSAGGFFPPPGGYQYTREAGWHTLDETACRDPSPAVAARRMWSKSSESRNRYLYQELQQNLGRIDLRSARAVYAHGPRSTFADWREFEHRWHAGEKLQGSTANRGNAFTALISAADGHCPDYWGCVGMASDRSSSPNRAGHGYFYVDETYTFWRLSLGDSPTEVLQCAATDAELLVRLAVRVAPQNSMRTEPLQRWLTAAQSELAMGRSDCAPDSINAIARRLRALTRAQVRARQVLRALQPDQELRQG